MEIVIIVLIGVLILLSIIGLLVKPKMNLDAEMLKKLNEKNKQDLENLYALIQQNNNTIIELIKVYNINVADKVNYLTESNVQNLKLIQNNLKELSGVNEKQMDKLILETRENLTKLNETNEKKLDEMRVVVDEKLNATLNDRLNKSFQIVSEQLQAVTKGLGEMQMLANGVGDLKKVLTNVKNRGTFGEVQLGALLSQMLAPNQFKEQVMLKEGSTERVDYAVLLPGKDGKELYLPIDAKFPMEDYLKLVDSQNAMDQEGIILNQNKLIKRIKTEAKSICDKYIQVPLTTDFAVMYLPTEGLYAEVIKQDELFEQIQREYKVTICGPTTISALLNSLQMGFKSLAIEKRSSEIYSMLATFKKEFGNYVELLTKTQKKLNEATDTIDSATKKSMKIQKQLDKVDFDDGTGLIGNDD